MSWFQVDNNVWKTLLQPHKCIIYETGHVYDRTGLQNSVTKSSFTSNLPEVPLCFLTVRDLYRSDCQSWVVNSDSAVGLEPLQGPWKAEAPWGKWLAVLSLLFLGPTQTVVSSTGLLEFDFVSAKLWYVSLGVYFPQCIVLPCNKTVLNYVAMNHQRQSWRWKSKNTITPIPYTDSGEEMAKEMPPFYFFVLPYT